MVAMKEFFHDTSASPAGRWGRFRHEFGAGCSKLLRLFGQGDGMSPKRVVALQKRELEEKLLAEGYSLRLAKIAVSEAFKPAAQPH